MQNKTRIVVIIVFFATLGFIYNEKSKQPQPPTTANAVTDQLAKPILTESGKEVKAAAPSTSVKIAPEATSAPPPLPSESLNADKTKIEEGEIQKLKELNKIHVAKVTLRMKNDEIASLKKSIVNDQLIIQKIEKDGSSIEYYKMMQSNLDIRKKRLQQLLKK